MRTITIHPASLVIGLVLGVCVTMAMGQAPAPRAGDAAAPRYQISSSHDQGVIHLSILDHQTQKVYFFQTGAHRNGSTIEWILSQGN